VLLLKGLTLRTIQFCCNLFLAMKHISVISYATLLIFFLAIVPVGCHKRTTPPIQKADVQMIGSDGLEPTDTSSTPEGNTGSPSLGEAEEEEPASPNVQARETEPTVSQRPSSRAPSATTSFDPSRSLFRNVSNDVSEDISKEQEDFFLKNAMATRGHYEGADGELLIPKESIQKLEGMINSRFPVQLKVSCESVTVTVPSGNGEPIPAVMDILGEKIEAKAKTSAETASSYVDVELIYMYTINAGEGSPENASLTAGRTARYRPNSAGHWRKTKVEERIISEVTPKPAAKISAGSKKSTAKPKASTKPKSAKKAKQPKAAVKKETRVEEPTPSAFQPATVEKAPTAQPVATAPATAVPPKPTEAPAQPTAAPVKPTEAPAKPPVAPPKPPTAPPANPAPAPSGNAEFDEMLIPDAPNQ
jgi:hypothetical protein